MFLIDDQNNKSSIDTRNTKKSKEPSEDSIIEFVNVEEIVP